MACAIFVVPVRNSSSSRLSLYVIHHQADRFVNNACCVKKRKKEEDLAV